MVFLRTFDGLTQVDVRADADGAARLGLPTQPNTVAPVGDGRAALWLGPDEWLVIDPSAQPRDLETALRGAADGAFVTTVDVSDNRLCFELSGAGARDVLQAGCPIDLDPPAFGPARCAQTLLARASVVVWQTDDAPTYRLLVRPSFAPYLERWLEETIAAGVA